MKIRGKATNYTCSTTADVDHELTKLTIRWRYLMDTSPATCVQVVDAYWYDVDLLLEAWLALEVKPCAAPSPVT